MSLMSSEATVGSRVMLSVNRDGRSAGSAGTIEQTYPDYSESYVRFDNGNAGWYYWYDLEPERALTAETADTLERFQRLVIERSLERQRRHSLCTEVQSFLIQDLGLTLPPRKVLVTVQVEVEELGDYNNRSNADSLVLRAVQSVQGQGSARIIAPESALREYSRQLGDSE